MRTPTFVLVGVIGWGLVSCSIECPDGTQCSDSETCCMTKDAYACCHYPQAVCCSDMAHCCPSNFHCNLTSHMCEQVHWRSPSGPMLKKVSAEEPDTPALPLSQPQGLDNSVAHGQTRKEKSSVVYCDNYFFCPDGATCCRHPAGPWFCCPYFLAKCCLDGYHCCPAGYDCDLTYTHCVRQGLTYPFTPRKSVSLYPAAQKTTLADELNEGQ